jgi:outer membrane protein
MEAIKNVAKEKGYSYVLDESTNSLLVAPPGDDLLAAVKAKLGIKDPAPAAKPAGAKN